MPRGTGQSSFAVARFLIDRASADGVGDLTPMKAIKLAYIAHGWVLCFTDEPLFAEAVEAWKYGPVVPSLYRYLKQYGSSPIPRSDATALPEISVDDRTRRVLDAVWTSYKGYSGIQLSAMTHDPNTPWYETWHLRGGKDHRGAAIDNMLIRDHYRSLLTRRRSGAGGAIGAPA